MSTKPETLLRRKIQAALRKAGAFATVIHGSVYQEAGLPDLCCVYRGRSLWLEVKLPGQTPSTAQIVMRARLELAGAVCEVATSVEEALRALSDLDERIRIEGRRRVA